MTLHFPLDPIPRISTQPPLPSHLQRCVFLLSTYSIQGHRPYRTARYFSFTEGMDATCITISTPHRDLEGLKTSMEETTRVDVARRLFCWEGSAESGLKDPTSEAETWLLHTENHGQQTQAHPPFEYRLTKIRCQGQKRPARCLFS